MSKQLTMFESFDEKERLATPLARRTDPPTSHAAAQSAVQSGLISRQCRECLEVVRMHPGLTSAELGDVSNMGSKARWIFARRLPDLEKAGLVRKDEARVCTINGTKAVTWEAL